MSAQEDPEKQYTDDGERENPQQMPNIGSDPTELPQEEPARTPEEEKRSGRSDER
jgi:hypothetical protein